MMNFEERFTPQVVELMRSHIADADGNEVFFAGKIDQTGRVVFISAAARGNVHEVPVNFAQSREAAVLIHNHPSGNLHPSDADLAVASSCSEDGKGFYIINNDVTDLYAVMEPVLPKVIVPLESEKAAFYLSSKGPLAQQSEFYEERPVQLDLIRRTAETFNKNGIGIFEAGTGVGKSFAYLIPSMLWALQNKQRVVLSTGTINLQQQLIEKDIPAAEKIIGKKIKSVLVKGRQNFLCLRRLSEAGKERDLFSEETEIFDKIAAWAKETPTGSRSDLSFLPPENIWQRVNSESDACMGMRCPFRESCFVMKVRKEAADAQLLVVNHHLLFADIEARMSGIGYDDSAVLPPYRRIVFDEAHGIEDAATSFFSEAFSRFKLVKQLNLLYRQRKGTAAGFLFTVAALALQEDNSNLVMEEINKIRESLLNLEIAAENSMEKESSIRLYHGTAARLVPVLKGLSDLQNHLSKVTGLVREMMENIDDSDKDNPVIWETKAVLRRLDDVAALCSSYSMWDEHTDYVFWIQKQRLPQALVKDGANPFYVQFYKTPLDIAPMMNSGIYEPMESVVNMSATLGIGGTFDYWKKRTGIHFAEKSRIEEGAFPSPFPYRTNLLFAVPSDAPFPDSQNFQAWIEEAVIKLIRSAKGRTLVLFTSYDSLRHACDSARTGLRDFGLNILRQGDDDRFRLLSAFKNDLSSVLFATSSFWEGVDVPGDSLSQVIIVKLPFGVPSDPIFAARSEQIQSRGGSPFMELSVPQAVIQFRQGFGRLIRRSDDRGDVVVLDRRIMEKAYGRIFIASMPDCKKIYSPLNEILESVENFLS